MQQNDVPALFVSSFFHRLDPLDLGCGALGCARQDQPSRRALSPCATEPPKWLGCRLARRTRDTRKQSRGALMNWSPSNRSAWALSSRRHVLTGRQGQLGVWSVNYIDPDQLIRRRRVPINCSPAGDLCSTVGWLARISHTGQVHRGPESEKIELQQ